MLFRVLIMMAVLLGVWLGFGAPIGGIGISAVKPDPRIPTFADTVRELEGEEADNSAEKPCGEAFACNDGEDKREERQEAPELE